MAWNDGDGPWGQMGGGNKDNGSANGGGNPWGGGGRKPRSGGGGGTQPPDIEEALRKLRNSMAPFSLGGNGKAAIIAVAVLVLVWLGSGFYQVATDQIGVVTRFGAFVRTEVPGLHYHLPAPIEDVYLPVVTSQNEIQIGFKRMSKGGNTLSLPEESMMLTQDENVIDVEFTVFWRISDAKKYLFEIRSPDATIKMAAESAMREVIGQNKLEFALTEGRGQIAEEARIRLQALLDEYQSGVIISQINLQTVSVPTEVKAAFQDVVNAKLNQEQFQNEAATHVNKVIPDAKGKAAQIVQQAMAYRDQKIAIAQGEADRFREVLTAYNMSREVTSQRIYLETMEAVLANASKVVMDKNAAGGGTIPFFPLRDMMGSKRSNGTSE